jgi:opacity protein-like surface antigen
MALQWSLRSSAWLQACVVLVFLAWPGVAAGQSTVAADQAAQPVAVDRPRQDYMFGRPRTSIAFRGSWVFAMAGSDVFDFVTEQLTLEKSDFNAPGIAFDLDVALTPRVDIQVSVDNSFTSTDSEYRDYVDNDEQPIEQTTSMRQFGISASAKYALLPRGRSISRFAWVPRTTTPYVGAGAGLLKYDFKQEGDFVDFVDLSVFYDVFHSEGWAPSVHFFGGVDVKVYQRLYVTAEARYVWSEADLETDFDGFEPIDLSGFRCGAGIRFVF